MSNLKKTSLITVQNIPVTIMNVNQNDYICLTDMVKARADAPRAADIIKNWLRTRSTLEFWVLGKFYITPLLKWSNSTTLKAEPVSILSR